MDGDTVGNPDVTLLVMLLDRSGSMHRIRAEVEEGFDAFIADQRDDGGRCTVSLYQFDSGFEPVYVGVPIGDVPPLSIRPRGNTALYDAIGRTILSTRAWLDAVPADDRPGTVLVGILTDGRENSSREFEGPTVRAMIEQQEGEGWEFLYMGAEQDAIEVGMSLGVTAEKSLTYSKGRAREATDALRGSVRRYKDAMRAGLSPEEARALSAFTEEERRSVSD